MSQHQLTDRQTDGQTAAWFGGLAAAVGRNDDDLGGSVRLLLAT